jgi:ankyrin repeat protein
MENLAGMRKFPFWIMVAFLVLFSPVAQAADEYYSIPAAAAKNDIDGVARLLVDGKSPNDVDSDGRTGLIYAAMFGNAPMAQYLIQHGADARTRDGLGYTALHWAAQQGSIGVIGVLINAGLPVDVTTKEGITPLMMAADHNQLAVIHKLLDNGADPKRQDFSGRDAEGWAIGKPAALKILQGTASH